MNNKIHLFILLVCYKPVFSQLINDPDPVTVWPLYQLPVQVTIDNLYLPNNIPNTTTNRNGLIIASHNWNNNPSLGSLVNVTEGFVDNNINNFPAQDGLNEIKFGSWPPGQESDHLAITVGWSNNPCNYGTPGYPNACVKTRLEADIYFKPNYIFNNFTAQKALKHEMGHLLGMKRHDGNPSALMYESGLLNNGEITDFDWENLKKLYPSLDTIDIIIGSPSDSEVVIANEPHEFSANIVPFGNAVNQFSAADIKVMEDQLVWTSSVDGEIAVGNNQFVSGLSPGQHDLTVTIGEPGDQVYGDGTSTFFVVDQIITTEADSFHPYPCPRSSGHTNSPCLLSTQLDLYRYDNCSRIYSHGPTSALDLGDLLNNSSDDVSIPVYSDPFPYCQYNNPNYSYNFHTWLYSDDNLLNFQLNYVLESVGETPLYFTFNHPIPLVNPEVTVHTIDDCQVSTVVDKCAVTIDWSDLYFSPDAGIYYRPSPTSNWQLLRRISERNGSYTTPNIVDFDGVEFAVFQYSRDIRGRNQAGIVGGPGSDLYIEAPNGMLAGPISVKAIAADTTPVPTLDSVAAINTTTYKVELLGDNFGNNPSLSVRENIAGSPSLAVYSSAFFHNQGVNTTSGKDFIRIPILKVARQTKFRSNGLCFKVLNGSLHSNEKCYKIPARAAKPGFMGAAVQSYNQANSQQDIDSDAYVTKANGNQLKLWGNSWKKIAKSYTVTPNTEFEVKFKSTHSEGEIIGVGFVMNGEANMSATRFWQLHGTPDTLGNQEHNNYSGTDYKTYKIKIGEKFTGQISHMVFVGDYDNQQAAMNSVFEIPKLYERGITIDAYDNVPAQRAFDDDVNGRGVPWTGSAINDVVHNFHDSADKDWVIIVAEDFRVRTELIGQNAATKIQLYKWFSAAYDSNLGYYTQVNDVLLDESTNSWSVPITNWGNSAVSYAVKVESLNGNFGVGTDYKLIFEGVPIGTPDVYESGLSDDNESTPISWAGGDVEHVHNFHDNNDADWTIVYAQNFTAFAQAVGNDADLKMTVYRWSDADYINGQFVNIVSHFYDRDISPGNSTVQVNYHEPATFVIKVEARNGAYGNGTSYKLKLF
ncbi:MAG: hypothetical protein KDI92_11455 [Xanthomonadales bacterium]|nr:hypothetical protein [Xanthomonadales bacterium]